MTFVEDGLVRRVLERAFNFLKFGEIAFLKISHKTTFFAKPAGVAIFDKAGLPFHDLPIPGANPTPCSRKLLENTVKPDLSQRIQMNPSSPAVHLRSAFPVRQDFFGLPALEGGGFSALPERPRHWPTQHQGEQAERRGAGRPRSSWRRTGP
jgi:hypothetical protein